MGWPFGDCKALYKNRALSVHASFHEPHLVRFTYVLRLYGEVGGVGVFPLSFPFAKENENLVSD